MEDLGLHDSTTDRCRVSPRTCLSEDVKMPAWLKAYNKVCQPPRKHNVTPSNSYSAFMFSSWSEKQTFAQ